MEAALRKLQKFMSLPPVVREVFLRSPFNPDVRTTWWAVPENRTRDDTTGYGAYNNESGTWVVILTKNTRIIVNYKPNGVLERCLIQPAAPMCYDVEYKFDDAGVLSRVTLTKEFNGSCTPPETILKHVDHNVTRLCNDGTTVLVRRSRLRDIPDLCEIVEVVVAGGDHKDDAIDL